METIVPEYYGSFKCIADRCLHTCCRGWEIDVDDISLERYQTIPSIINKIEDGQMVLDEEENCPFLLSSGLCRMIIDHGEDMLCDICRDHPRFRNYYDDHIEMGLGLTCEAACSLILDWEFPFRTVPEIMLPDEITEMTARNTPVVQRLDRLCENVPSLQERVDFFLSLERLDEKWTELLMKVKDGSGCSFAKADEDGFIGDHPLQFEQFVVYLLFRHKDEMPDAGRFAVMSARLLADICLSDDHTDIYEAARMFSSEVEYSDINLEKCREFCCS